MVVITFPDRDTAKRAVGFLVGRFSGRVLSTGECIIPEAALAALAHRSFEFTVKGKATLAGDTLRPHLNYRKPRS
jgi:hypothetical protein